MVPLAWFVIAFITFSLVGSKYTSTKTYGKGIHGYPQIKIRHFILPILLAAFGTVAWDFMIDPMFSNYGYWSWQIVPSTPQLYGVPLTNFVGWFVVAILMLVIFVVSLKYLSKNSTGLFRRGNTWDSRIAYILLLIDAAVANSTLGQYYAVSIGVVAMLAFLVITFQIKSKRTETVTKKESATQI